MIFDIIVHAVLVHLGLTAEPLVAGDEGQRYRNARRLVNGFGGRPIKAIKAIKDVTGLSVRECRDAWEGILEIHGLENEYHRAAALYYLQAEMPELAEVHIRKVRT